MSPWGWGCKRQLLEPLGALFKTPTACCGLPKKLIQDGAQAIAVVARFPDDIDSAVLQHYRHGQGVDPLAGAEAVISHLVVRRFRVPCAHAPALAPLPLDPQISPRSAAEELGYTFLPCVLVGLGRAPQFIDRQTPPQSHDLWTDQVNAVVIPATACGGSGLLSLAGRSQPPLIIAVGDNQTRMQVLPEALGIPATSVNSYLEALGLLVLHRSGLRLESLNASISPLQPLEPAGEIPQPAAESRFGAGKAC